MMGPCLCGDMYCMSCGGICSRCEGAGWLIDENNSRYYFLLDEVINLQLPKFCSRTKKYTTNEHSRKNVEKYLDRRFSRCRCNPTDEQLEKMNEDWFWKNIYE